MAVRKKSPYRRVPRRKAGRIQVWYGVLPEDRHSPDVCVNWQSPAHKGVALNLMEVISKSKIAVWDGVKTSQVGVIDYLRENGYNLNTLTLTVDRLEENN